MSDFKSKIRLLGLRPTQQRITIMQVLSEIGKTHVTARCLLKILSKKNKRISIATIYNNLNELSDRGFLNKVVVGKEKMWFDTNLANHHHFYDEEADKLVDIDFTDIEFSKFPDIPSGKTLKSVNVVINVKKKN